MDWEAIGPYLLLFIPVLMGIALTIAVKKMNAEDNSEDS